NQPSRRQKRIAGLDSVRAKAPRLLHLPHAARGRAGPQPFPSSRSRSRRDRPMKANELSSKCTSIREKTHLWLSQFVHYLGEARFVGSAASTPPKGLASLLAVVTAWKWLQARLSTYRAWH